MSSLFGIGANGASSFYNGVATQSLRFNDDDDAYLSRTPSSASNRKTWTYSTWFKIGNTSVNHTIFSGGSANAGRVALYLSSGGKLITDLGQTGSYDESVSLFRDVSAWYHLVWAFDTTQSTGSNRSRMYINGTEITLTKTRTWSLNTDYAINSADLHSIGGFSNSPTAFSSDKYQAETNFVDGQQLDPTSFGETKNGVWIAKRYTGSYGTNGFRLQFNQTGTGSASSSTIGADTSGNANHFSSSGIVASDCDMPDSPENNFCTLNPNARGTTNISTSEGNLKFVKSSANYGNIFSTFPLFSGKWYFEGRCLNNDLAQIGVTEVTNNIYQNSGDVGFNTDLCMWDSRGYYLDEGTAGGSPPTYTTGDIIGVAFDVEAGKIWFSKNGTYNHSGDPANGTNQTTGSTNDLSSIGVIPAGNGENGGGHTFNFGQDGTFAGAETAQGNTDGNGIGDFYYAPPSGFLAICTANLPEPTISPNEDTQADDYFSPTLYTSDNIGAGGTQSVTGVGFQPDWVWIKNRSSSGTSHTLFDSVRTAGKMLQSDTNSAEASNSQYGYLSSFDNDGFTLTGGTTNANFINQGTDAYVSWNWKAGGTAVSNTDGTITSSVSANTDAGFSIVSYTSNNSAGATVGHGLGVAPQMVIIKKRSASERWFVWHTGDSTEYMYLNETFAGQANLDDRFGNNTTVTLPSSTLLTLGTNNDVNGTSGSTYIAYCFAEIEGYSKFGSYTGNGSTDGAFIYTGFRPAFIMIKRTDSTGHWEIHDTTRDSSNVSVKRLFPNYTNAEDSDGAWDILSNGFKLRTTHSSINASGASQIYMAFAENPFKYSTAR